MTRIAFIGLGNMGGGMAARLVGAGHEVIAYDLSGGGVYDILRVKYAQETKLQNLQETR